MFASAQLLYQLITSNIPQYPTVTGLPQPITARSMAGFFYALGWGWILLVAFTGWGRLSGKLCRVERLPASIACVLGIATVVCLAGWLNIFHAIYADVIFSVVAIGLLAYWFHRKCRPEPYRWSLFWAQLKVSGRVLLVIALIVLAFRVAASVRPGMLNDLDDGPAYLLFPHKMLALHHFAADPFSDRRVTSSLGGSYLLQTFVIAGTSLANAEMADRSLGLVLLAGALFDLGIVFGLSAFQIAMLEFLALLVPQEAMNLTFIMLPPAILLAMIWFVLRTPEENAVEGMKYAFLAGAVGGALISLKSTYLPIVGAVAIVPYVLPFVRTKNLKFLSLPVIAGLGSLAVVAAWMVAMKLTSGTYLFPVLGHGFDYSAYGQFPSTEKFHTARAFFKIFLQGIALVALAVVLVLLDRLKDKRTQFSFSILLAAVVAITAFNYKSGGDSIWRYNFPQFFTAILIFYAAVAYISDSGEKSRYPRFAFYAGILAVFGMIFYYDAAGQRPRPFRQVSLEWGDYKPGLEASLSGLALASPAQKQEYFAVEASLPPNAVALENTAYPFLFRYGGNTIFAADWPGAASPPPGWPFPTSLDRLVHYLRLRSIRFVIYDYGYARWTDVEGCKALESPNLNSQWLRDQWLMNLLSHDQFDHLRTHYRSVYDDRKIAVIDLEQPIANAPADGPLWTISTSTDDMCQIAMADYLANPLPARPRQ